MRRIPLMRAAAPLPRAIAHRRVRADTPSNAEIIARVQAGVDRLQGDHETRLAALEANADDNARVSAALRLNGGSDSDGLPVDREYTTAFASYTRRGATDAEVSLSKANATGDRKEIRAAMSEGDNSAGGYLAPVEWDRQVRKSQRHLSPMRRLCQVVTTSVNGYSTLWAIDEWGTGWVGETAARPATTNAMFSPLVFPAGEIYAMPAATQRLLDDAVLDFEAWIATELGDQFGREEGIAFVAGDGVNKPMGFLQNLPGGAAAAAVVDAQGNVTTPARPGAHPGGNLATTPSGAADKLTTDGLVDLKYGLATPYRQNATWVMNSNTAALIAKMKDGQGGYIWRESLLASEPATLLGRPVEIDENMPNVAAGSTPIAFGDFSRGYLINDRIGIRVLRDPYTAKPYVLFYATKRVGGGVLDPRAICVLRVAAA
jgi:HK97 family phage major capsid protein